MQVGLAYFSSEVLEKELLDPRDISTLTINSLLDSLIYTEFDSIIHFWNSSLKGRVILNVYKDKISQALIIGEHLTSTFVSSQEQGSDTQLGRWRYVTLQASGNKKITFPTVYRVCNQVTTPLNSK